MTVFSKPGKENTAATVKIALDAAKARGIRHIVVASYTGYTADFFKDETDLKIVVVRGTYGYNVKEPGDIRMPAEKYTELCAAGMTVVTAAHALSGAERALSNVFKGTYPVEMIAPHAPDVRTGDESLRRMRGHGVRLRGDPAGRTRRGCGRHRGGCRYRRHLKGGEYPQAPGDENRRNPLQTDGLKCRVRCPHRTASKSPAPLKRGPIFMWPHKPGGGGARG